MFRQMIRVKHAAVEGEEPPMAVGLTMRHFFFF
jgi:hypothetical protein